MLPTVCTTTLGLTWGGTGGGGGGGGPFWAVGGGDDGWVEAGDMSEEERQDKEAVEGEVGGPASLSSAAAFLNFLSSSAASDLVCGA